MSFFSSIVSFIFEASGFISNILKKGTDLFSTVDLSSKYDDIEKTFDFYQKIKRGNTPSHYSSSLVIDDELNSFSSNKNELSEKVSLHGSDIEEIKERLKDWNDIMGLRIDLSRLLSSALMIERASSNAQMHSSNLNIHHQSIKNISGLMTDVNSIRYGLKKIISTLNHNINKINSSGSVNLDKIENVDIDIKQGEAPQIATLEAFDTTRSLLIKEIKTIQILSREHIVEVNSFKRKVASYGGGFAGKVIQILDQNITPRLRDASKLALLLESDLRHIPVPKRNENGQFITKVGDSGIEIEFDFSET
ncbi:hypothetical protein MNY66_17900 (plasmid) [Moellerella wisconsensis]|uniref:hypothetical protein n=1 Tax=Moellerella wisconsensis TaxID=158849 RepID=UPI001F4DEAF9|nr:hypothetical protein [Moellerella wisconsensis]UNH44430.1 hypothetical protein MNY66_17900 [Moellerella wisconsensis]